ncbi:hypothetical protein ACFU6I_44240 [Streptomyces sp. NPDC057486]|uniref:hypothetical protein n=1 Tax=Streptomyces sp. NPDC057486 TaxID=3346145 RepID=UPI00369981D0
MTLERGRFVTLDGPSGVGKSTTIQALRDELFNRGIAVRQALEPTTRDIGRFISAHSATSAATPWPAWSRRTGTSTSSTRSSPG